MSKNILTTFEVKILKLAINELKKDLIYERWFGIFKKKKKADADNIRLISITIESIENKLRL